MQIQTNNTTVTTSARRSVPRIYRRAEFGFAVGVAFVFLGITSVLISLDAYEWFYQFSRDHEDWELDDLLLVAIALLVSLAVNFSIAFYLRGQELKAEIKRRERYEADAIAATNLRSLGTLVAGMSHSLNNLLQPILSLSQQTLKNVPADGRNAECLKIVIDAATQAKVLVGDILLFSRQSGSETSDVPIVRLVRTAYELVHATLPSRINLQADLSDVGRCRVEVGQVQGAFLNILQNSIDAMAETGTIHMALSQIGAEGAPALHGHSGTFALIEISDSGIGMDQATLRQALNPFFTTKPPSKGTGLGLAIAATVIRESGGEIELSSRPGQGTKVRVYLPLLED